MNTAELTPAGELTAEELGTVHLIGIGGVGMSGLARLMLTRGVPVSGSELREWPALAALRALGGTIHMAHAVSNLDGVDTVVYSSAIFASGYAFFSLRSTCGRRSGAGASRSGRGIPQGYLVAFPNDCLFGRGLNG